MDKKEASIEKLHGLKKTNAVSFIKLMYERQNWANYMLIYMRVNQIRNWEEGIQFILKTTTTSIGKAIIVMGNMNVCSRAKLQGYIARHVSRMIKSSAVYSASVSEIQFTTIAALREFKTHDQRNVSNDGKYLVKQILEEFVYYLKTVKKFTPSERMRLGNIHTVMQKACWRELGLSAPRSKLDTEIMELLTEFQCELAKGE